MAAAISIGLPRLSFTLILSLLRLCTRSEMLLARIERIGPAQPRVAIRAAVFAEQQQQRGLVRLQHVEAAQREEPEHHECDHPADRRAAWVLHEEPRARCEEREADDEHEIAVGGARLDFVGRDARGCGHGDSRVSSLIRR